MAVAVTPLEKEIKKLCDDLDNNPGEEWNRRVIALRKMVEVFHE